jgi:hypothetical protein
MLGTKTRVAVVLAASLALTATATPAYAAPATLVSVGPGTLVADGAAVDVPVTFVCDSDPTRIIAVPVVEMNQRVTDGRIANGFGNAQLGCTRESQTVTIRVIPRVMAFDPGAAVAFVVLQTCSAEFQCAAVTASEVIQLSQSGQAQIPPVLPE